MIYRSFVIYFKVEPLNPGSGYSMGEGWTVKIWETGNYSDSSYSNSKDSYYKVTSFPNFDRPLSAREIDGIIYTSSKMT